MKTVVIPILIVSSIAGAACSDEETPAVCAARDDLADSVQELRDVDVLDDGLDALSTAADDVSTELSAFRSAASAELQPEIDAVRAALDELRSAVGTEGSPVEIAPAIGAAVRALASAWDGLVAAVGSTCE